ncbi:type II toxin-antitoxin system RelE/ParE family toxin, partial [Candidatus Gottesmanbacteria bacterium]|nr:type II toxin-antitoxin system RelE/ParE family toxin [Candidatus Gottesmanbacteria bacterium]
IEPKLWEARIKAGNSLLRIFYTYKKGRVIILLHIFVKKEQKTPTKELEVARNRLKEIEREES